MIALNSKHEIFRFKTLDQLEKKIKELNLDLHLTQNLESLKKNIEIRKLSIPNRLCIHPMEGCDATKEGSPTALTKRRYQRFGKSGVGIIWYESTAINSRGRSNPYQLILKEENKNDFRALINEAEKAEEELNGKNRIFKKSIKILQLNHSGRYSRPDKKFPQRIYSYESLDKAYNQSISDGIILSDDDLGKLREDFIISTSLAKEIGFDGVDIKICHRYLLNESLSAFTRDNSKYGGTLYENRTRLVKSIIKEIVSKFSSNNFLISSRINMYDGIPYPYGWGVEKRISDQYPPKPDLTEPVQLIKDLHNIGIDLFNLTLGNPYFDSSISRPFDQPVSGGKIPNEHPLQGIFRFINLTRKIKASIPSDIKIIGTGYSWLRQYSPLLAAYEISKGNVDMVGFGRMSFANPEFGQQILLNNKIDPKKCCITCSKCTELMRKGTVTGCVIRDSEVYLPYYKGKEREYI
ncbi:MAG: oxidoreductase [Promethearchaeota archaeon]